MDNRRWNTQQILGGGILDKPIPETSQPEGLKLLDDEKYSEDGVRSDLESGGLTAAQYYGCWSIWQTPSGYSGELIQYRSVTDRISDAPIDEAIEKAMEWASSCYG